MAESLHGWSVEEAYKTISRVFKIDPTRAAAGITKLWITYYHTGIDDAIRL